MTASPTAIPEHTVPHMAVLITCHNRRDITVACVVALRASAGRAVQLSVVVVDAGSSDGTADALRALPGELVLIERGRDVYWNAGMRVAWSAARELEPDFYLWLNDDLQLQPQALVELLKAYDQEAGDGRPKTVVVGKTVCPHSGETTYGGYRRAAGLSRIRWRRLRGSERSCDTMNGNCVLLPATVVNHVGIHSEAYGHAFGDIDYGLRAGRAGYNIVELDRPVGLQEKNEGHVYTGARISLNAAGLKSLLAHPKGIPLREWLHFCRAHAGPLWPVNFALRYIKALAPWGR